MNLSLISITIRLRTLALLPVLLLWPSTVAFTPQPINVHIPTARSLGVPLDVDPSFVEALATSSIVISAAKVTAAGVASGSSTAAVTSTTESSAVLKFFAGSAVFLGIVGTFKWNDAESSDQIRESWEKLVDSTSSFGTAPPEPSVPRMESSVVESESPVPVATPAAKVVAATLVKSTPNAKDATSPEALIEMMKDVGDATAPKKKRFIVRLLKKVVMPWKKWSNL